MSISIKPQSEDTPLGEDTHLDNECLARVVESLSVFTLMQPQVGRHSSVIVTSPHSGRAYPLRFLEQSALGLDALRQVEDAGMDRLLTFQPLPCALLMANFPRSFVDLNRNADEIDAAMFEPPAGAPSQSRESQSRYVRWGLGVIPKKVSAQQDIYASPLPLEELRYRIAHYYNPFHFALNGLVDDSKKHGQALLIDCHSMPSGIAGSSGTAGPSRLPSKAADIVIGSRHGTSANPAIIAEAFAYFEHEGLKVALDTPFAGGYITSHYGRPADGVSALQIEISRGLYLDEARIEFKRGWRDIASTLCGFILAMDAFCARLNHR